jgi:hypothetical protein
MTPDTQPQREPDIGFGDTVIDEAYRLAIMSTDDEGNVDLEKIEERFLALRSRPHTPAPAPTDRDHEIVSMPRYIFEMLTKERKPTGYEAMHTPAPAIHLCCDKCGSIAPHFDGKNQWLCTKCLQSEATRAATLAAYSKVLEDCCKECPVKEEIPVEDYCAESCEGCLVRSTVQSLRSAGDEPHE